MPPGAAAPIPLNAAWIWTINFHVFDFASLLRKPIEYK